MVRMAIINKKKRSKKSSGEPIQIWFPYPLSDAEKSLFIICSSPPEPAPRRLGQKYLGVAGEEYFCIVIHGSSSFSQGIPVGTSGVVVDPDFGIGMDWEFIPGQTPPNAVTVSQCPAEVVSKSGSIFLIVRKLYAGFSK
jgi:hypothetical protein